MLLRIATHRDATAYIRTVVPTRSEAIVWLRRLLARSAVICSSAQHPSARQRHICQKSMSGESACTSDRAVSSVDQRDEERPQSVHVEPRTGMPQIIHVAEASTWHELGEKKGRKRERESWSMKEEREILTPLLRNATAYKTRLRTRQHAPSIPAGGPLYKDTYFCSKSMVHIVGVG